MFQVGYYTSIKSSRKNSERIDKKLRETSKDLNWEGLKFSVHLSDINKFENHNSSISVNVFGYEKLVCPLRISQHNYKRESTVNLLKNSCLANILFYHVKVLNKEIHLAQLNFVISYTQHYLLVSNYFISASR